MSVDLLLSGSLTLFFDLCFVAACVALAWRVRPARLLHRRRAPAPADARGLHPGRLRRPRPDRPPVRRRRPGRGLRPLRARRRPHRRLRPGPRPASPTASARAQRPAPSATSSSRRVELRPRSGWGRRRRTRTTSGTSSDQSMTVVGCAGVVAGVDHEVDDVVELLLDLPAQGPGLLLAGQDQRAGEQRLPERGQQRVHDRVVGDAHPDGALLGVHQPARHLAGRRQDERVRTRAWPP